MLFLKLSSKVILFLILILTACFSQFGADIYAPALPVIANYFKSSIKMVELTMSCYMAGVACSQLIYGPLSEIYGRKIPFLVGLFIAFVGGLICNFSLNIKGLLLGRVVQGVGAGACATLWRPVFRDLYSAEELSKYSSYLVIIIVFIIPVAPLVGGYIESYVGWRYIFLFLSFYSLFAFLMLLFYFKETNQHFARNNANAIFIIKTYESLITSKTFMAISICTFLSYGAFFSWFTCGPVLLIKTLGISALQFGWFSFLGCGGAYAIAGKLNGMLVGRVGMMKLLRLGWFLMIVAGLLMCAVYYTFGLTRSGVMLPIIIFYFGSTFIWPNTFSIAFTPHGKIAGYAGALYGFMQIGGGALIYTETCCQDRI